MVGFFSHLRLAFFYENCKWFNLLEMKMINENTYEVFMNDGMEKEYEINPNLQIEINHNPKNEKKNCMLEK
jgi:hypothetical protein